MVHFDWAVKTGTTGDSYEQQSRRFSSSWQAPFVPMQSLLSSMFQQLVRRVDRGTPVKSQSPPPAEGIAGWPPPFAPENTSKSLKPALPAPVSALGTSQHQTVHKIECDGTNVRLCTCLRVSHISTCQRELFTPTNPALQPVIVTRSPRNDK